MLTCSLDGESTYYLRAVSADVSWQLFNNNARYRFLVLSFFHCVRKTKSKTVRPNQLLERLFSIHGVHASHKRHIFAKILLEEGPNLEKLRNEISENDTTISSHQESLKRRNRLDPCTGFTRVSRRTLYQILVAESTGGELAVSMVSNLSDTRWARSGPEIIARSEI